MKRISNLRIAVGTSWSIPHKLVSTPGLSLGSRTPKLIFCSCTPILVLASSTPEARAERTDNSHQDLLWCQWDFIMKWFRLSTKSAYHGHFAERKIERLTLHKAYIFAVMTGIMGKLVAFCGFQVLKSVTFLHALFLKKLCFGPHDPYRPFCIAHFGGCCSSH